MLYFLIIVYVVIRYVLYLLPALHMAILSIYLPYLPPGLNKVPLGSFSKGGERRGEKEEKREKRWRKGRKKDKRTKNRGIVGQKR